MHTRCSARNDVRGVTQGAGCVVTEHSADGPARRSSSVSRGVVDGATANSLAADRRGPLQDDQAVKTKLLIGSCSRILDQGLGPTRARASRNRPLEPLRTLAGLIQGWAGHPCHTRRMQLTFHGNTRSGRCRAVLGHALGERKLSCRVRWLSPS
jgi:hypothetical protein